MKRASILFAVLMFLIWPLQTMGASPTETLQPPIDEVVGILTDPRYAGTSENPELKKAQRDKIWDVTIALFDSEFIAKSTLGRFHWQNTFSPEEQKTFVDVFSRFLGNTYIDKLQSGYQNEKITFVSEELLNPSKALVKSTVLQNKNVIPVDYLMRLDNGQWKIYDVNIEGVSLVQNYRSQFNSILMNDSAAKLIEQLRSKLN